MDDSPASQDSPPYVPNYDTGSCDDAENALAMARVITCGTTTTEAGSNQTAVVEVQGVQEKVHLELGLDQLRALVDHLSGRGPLSTTDDDNCWEERLSASQLSTSEPSASQPAESQQARPQRQRRGAPRQTGRVQQSENDQFRVVMQRLARDNEISLRKLGAALAHFDTGAQYHAFITDKMRECSISLNSAKAIQDTCSQIPHSSDSIVRSLTEVVAAQFDALVGVVTTVSTRCEFARANHRSIAKAEAMEVKNSSQSLPDEFFLHGRHLTQNWNIESDPPFKNLPDAVIEALVGCCLDGIGLGAKELVESTVEELIRSPTRYWETLGNDNSTRSQAFQERKKYRAIWGPFFRDALTKAMADVRQYVPKNGRLVPPPKSRKTSTSAATADESDDYDIFDEVRRT
ncbi:unnamed protein product [Heligmosomoides polygyrus]|uniref:Uncharacterized protein n=1 Tax=Heligmosomoides polygyrus TaxID=6339 RepID=A0A183GAD5_HELPZ|nr:unnamed protein product [Heligmosomoides polygyrus]